MANVLLEAPVFTVEAALSSESYGIDRIELCSNFEVGGETPSAGSLRFLKQTLSIPIYVMIRPRGGDFVYSNDEIQVMKEDIRISKEYGADGFVFGVLTPDGKLNVEMNKALIECADGLPCTLHRAFDATRDIFETLELAISCGFQRILTSGGENTVSEGLDTLLLLLKTAGNRIIIMPGGGLQPNHLSHLYGSGYLKEIHASCKGWRSSDTIYRKPGLELTKAEKIITIEKASAIAFKECLT